MSVSDQALAADSRISPVLIENAKQAYLITDFFLQSSVLLDMLALFLLRGLALVERCRRDAGNSVLMSKVSTSLPRM